MGLLKADDIDVSKPVEIFRTPFSVQRRLYLCQKVRWSAWHIRFCKREDQHEPGNFFWASESVLSPRELGLPSVTEAWAEFWKDVLVRRMVTKWLAQVRLRRIKRRVTSLACFKTLGIELPDVISKIILTEAEKYHLSTSCSFPALQQKRVQLDTWIATFRRWLLKILSALAVRQ